jgi:hypothetical protein
MREDLGPSSGATPDAPQYPPLPVKTATVIKVGMFAWAIALAVTLAVPDLHTGERSWWPWACVSGLVLGLIGYVYVRRGRGNAAGVE